MSNRYLIEIKTSTITPVIIVADSPQDATVKRVVKLEG